MRVSFFSPLPSKRNTTFSPWTVGKIDTLTSISLLVVFIFVIKCFQICFLNYEPKLEGEKTVQIDTDLIGESGEVDWHRLEAKTQSLIQEIFTSLPTI